MSQRLGRASGALDDAKILPSTVQGAIIKARASAGSWKPALTMAAMPNTQARCAQYLEPRNVGPTLAARWQIRADAHRQRMAQISNELEEVVVLHAEFLHPASSLVFPLTRVPRSFPPSVHASLPVTNQIIGFGWLCGYFVSL